MKEPENNQEETKARNKEEHHREPHEKREAGHQEEHRHDEHKKKKKTDEAGVEELKRLLEEKEENIKALQEKMLYLQAEFENFKRLKAKEKQEAIKYGNEVLIKDLIPVVDHLEMALEHASKTDECQGINEGVRMTLNEFVKTLEKAGVTRIDAIGKKFDPNLHEAFYQEEREDMEPDMVISEFQKGYLLNERLVRPSRVVLSKKPEIQ
ncbi:MAG TPA: nucleotide exchange factor GrpE [Syntrophorhabdaceae bacterium]|nr:nucleotide exchange factor GrpE [Syntrophorhabdaceae bacterium]